ncbi:MAG TPA: MarR family winged helix-turn-helix transcriptional regulator [Solirubrobacteraceae bacterium]|nr:MarR family winged helix-turn-helix transcriptional regulator [Solirubrobacteraceae bacterium]
MSLDPEDEVPPLGFLLVRIAEDVDRRFVAALGELGLRPRELRTLVLVDRHPGLSQRELARRLDVDPGNLVALLDGLDRAGLLTRRRDEADRRRRTLRLTAGGARLLARANRATAAVEDVVFGALTESERAALSGMALRVWRAGRGE